MVEQQRNAARQQITEGSLFAAQPLRSPWCTGRQEVAAAVLGGAAEQPWCAHSLLLGTFHGESKDCFALCKAYLDTYLICIAHLFALGSLDAYKRGMKVLHCRCIANQFALGFLDA